MLLTEICGAAPTAVAERLTTAGEAPLLPWTVSVPLNVPVADGVTATTKFPDWPVAMDIGSVPPAKLNCGLEIVAWVIETAVLPVLETAIVWVVCFPTPTFPKFTVVGLTWKAAWPVVVLVPLTIPAHPPRIPVQRSAVDNKTESST